MDSNNEYEPPCIILDIHVNASNSCVFSTKPLMTGNIESFATTFNSVLTEYAKSKEYNFVSRYDFVVDNDDPIKLEVRVMMARLTVVRCVGEKKMNILKFVQRISTVLTKQLDTKSCPIFDKGLNIEVASEEE